MVSQLISVALIASLKVGVEGKKVRIIAVGSVDGVCSAAALKRLLLSLGATSVVIEFSQAFAVDKLSPTTWMEEVVFFVDLAVNNRVDGGIETGFNMTCAFVRAVIEAGKVIAGVCDEHSKEDWQRVCAAVGLDFNSLAIQPVSQKTGTIKSSGALLLSVLGDQADEHTVQLCEAAAAGDRMDFSGPIGGPVNKSMKARIQDDTRRVYLADHYSAHLTVDEKMSGWVKEYEVIEANHQKVVESIDPTFLTDGIVLANGTGLVVDMTTLMGLLYKRGRVVILIGETFDKGLGRKVPSYSFGIPTGKGDLLAVLKAAGVDCSGFAEKANVKPEHSQAAITAVRAWLKAQA